MNSDDELNELTKIGFELFFGSSDSDDVDAEMTYIRSIPKIHAKRERTDTESETSNSKEKSKNINIDKNDGSSSNNPFLFTDVEFKENFRMNRSTFNQLCADISDTMEPVQQRTGRPEIDIDKQIMISLWYFANQGSLRITAEKFNCVKSTCTRIIQFISSKIMQLNIQNGIIRWPTEDEREATARYFYEKYRFQGIIGAIGGTHIRIKTPQERPSVYLNKNSDYTLRLQGVCNESFQFIHCYTGEVGSVDDSLLFSRSELEADVALDTFMIKKSEHLLGNREYPLKEWLLTPLPNKVHLSEAEKCYNAVHEKCREIIDTTFKILVTRFRRLQYIDVHKPDTMTLHIMVCCIIHNYCLKNNDQLEIDESDDEDDDGDEDEIIMVDKNSDMDEFGMIDDSSYKRAITKRNEIINELF